MMTYRMTCRLAKSPPRCHAAYGVDASRRGTDGSGEKSAQLPFYLLLPVNRY